MPKKSKSKRISKSKTHVAKQRKQPRGQVSKAIDEPGTLSPRSSRKFANVFSLMARAILVLKGQFKLFLGITAIYGALNLLLVRGLSVGVNLASVKSALHGNGSLATGSTLFIYLLGGSGNAGSSNAGSYQTILIIIVSLALVWSLRQVYAGSKVRIRDGFYSGIYPLVPVILIMTVIGLELLPFIIGASVYSIVMNNHLAAGAIQDILWLALLILATTATMYMLCSSVFALYIVTLPGMTPMKALKNARELVKHRRYIVVRKLLFLPLSLIVFAAIVMVPIILVDIGLAGWIFFVISMGLLAVAHSYIYALYRELLL